MPSTRHCHRNLDWHGLPLTLTEENDLAGFPLEAVKDEMKLVMRNNIFEWEDEETDMAWKGAPRSIRGVLSRRNQKVEHALRVARDNEDDSSADIKV